MITLEYVERSTTRSFPIKFAFCTESTMNNHRKTFFCHFSGRKPIERRGADIKIGTVPSKRKPSCFGRVNGLARSGLTKMYFTKPENFLNVQTGKVKLENVGPTFSNLTVDLKEMCGPIIGRIMRGILHDPLNSAISSNFHSSGHCLFLSPA